MKNVYAAPLVVLLLGLGAFVVKGNESREIIANPIQKAAMEKIARGNAELEDWKKKWEAAAKAHRDESAAIMAALRSDLRLVEGEDFVSYDPARGVFTVAFVGSQHAAAPPAPGK